MADTPNSNFTNTTTGKSNSFHKGMVKDTTDIFMGEGVYINAINAINNSHYGETGSIGNEPSNRLCITPDYTIIGYAHKKSTEWILFSTDDTFSEIGLFDESNCSYTVLVEDPCLGFKRTNLITAVCKLNYDGTYSAYFQDNLNPDRVLNTDRIPYLTTGNNLSDDPDCFIPEYTTDLDCDALRLHPLVTQPCLNLRKAQGGGQLSNGSYMAVIAYSEKGIKLTDYSIPTQPQALWSHTGIGGSLELTLENLDLDFEEYELVIISVINQQTIAKKIGNYSIRQTKVHIDLYNQSLETVNLASIPLRSTIYDKSEKMFDVNGYLIRTGVTTQPYFNYQELANNIDTRWVAVEYPKDYYWNGGNITGYMRDEVYSFFIRWVYKTGARSASFHIPGRPATASDRVSPGVTDDVIYGNETEKWQVYDTSTVGLASADTVKDGGIIIAEGKMGFWESTENYPDDQPGIWGDLCGKPIRHHKMPSNETIHIHNQGGDKINILGVKFYNVEYPVDSDGVPVPGLVGYEILRGSREGNRTIVAKGLFNNMWEYDIKGNTTKKGLYQNYPYNDLNDDYLLTTSTTSMDNGNGSTENLASPTSVDKCKKDYFSFHSPDTSFNNPYLGSNHIKIYTEERGKVLGRFSLPYKHPRHKVLTNASLVLASIIGIGIGLVAALGKTTTSGQVVLAPFGTGFITESSKEGGTTIATILDAQARLSVGTGTTSLPAQIAGIAEMLLQGVYYLGQGMDQVLDILYKLSPHRDYLLQYNSHGIYDSFSPVDNTQISSSIKPSFRRLVQNNGTKYIGSGLQDFDATYRINNLNRNKYVGVNLTQVLPNPTSIIEVTRKKVKDVGGSVTHKNPFNEFDTSTVAYYGAIKVDYQNQYGQIESIVQLPTDSCITEVPEGLGATRDTGVVFGGDVYINRYTEKNPYYFFNTWQMGEPNDTEFNYRNYVNGPTPRYWVDFNKYDITDLKLGLSGVTSPSDFFRFDEDNITNTGAFNKRNVWAYLFYNGVRDFFVESEINTAFRDYGEEDTEKFIDPYGNAFNDLETLFRSDIIKNPIYNKYDLSLSTSKLFNNFASWGSILPRDYDPNLYDSQFEYFPKRAVYSLQQQSGLKRDNWRNYLPLNYRDFLGKINSIKSLNLTGAIILFEDLEPMQFVGTDTLQTTNGVKVSVGDGGLFNQSMNSMVNADDTIEYGSSISSRGVINTPYGLFWIAQKTGKIMSYASNIDEVSKQGMKFWFAEHLPSKLLKVYPDYPLYDNPVVGIGCQAIYDPQYELIYFTKRDYVPLRDDFLFDDPSGIPYYLVTNVGPLEDTTIKKFAYYTDLNYFEPCNWTVSYDPKSKTWVSFHDWHPTLLIPSYNHFYTINTNSVWKHNDRWDSYSNYYGVNYPWEIEYPIITPNDITTLRSLEYTLDVYDFATNGIDFKHILDENFDRAIIYNSEQISGLLKLNIKGKNSPLDLINYPIIGVGGIDILFSKEENKFRFNQFWDITRNRGEFTDSERTMWMTKCSGYEKNINPYYVNYNKLPLERKKFRHYGNNIILRKNVSSNHKMILKLTNSKHLDSSR